MQQDRHRRRRSFWRLLNKEKRRLTKDHRTMIFCWSFFFSNHFIYNEHDCRCGLETVATVTAVGRGDTLKVIQTVIVKQIVTETSKRILLEEYVEQKRQLQKECEQLKFELKKQEKMKKFSPDLLKKKFNHEIHIREEKQKSLDFRMEQLHILPLGSEIKETELKALVEINEGDQWDDFLIEKSIVVKDGVVVEIRKG